MASTAPWFGRVAETFGLHSLGEGTSCIAPNEESRDEGLGIVNATHLELGNDGPLPVDATQEMLRSIIRQELKVLQESLACEIRASKEECLENLEYVKLLTEEVKGSLHEQLQEQIKLKQSAAGTSTLPLVTPQKDSPTPAETTPSANKFDELWEMDEFEKHETYHSWFSLAYGRIIAPQEKLHEWYVKHHLGFVPSERPKNVLVKICDTNAFHALQVVAVVANTIFSAFTSDQTIRRLLKDPPESSPSFWEHIDFAFTIYFCLEVLFRLMAFHFFFFTSPNSWLWNWFDLILCTISVAASGFNLNILRSLRVIRVIRMMRVLAESEYFCDLRTLLISVIACMIPLFWAVAFLALTFLIFSMLIMQAVSTEVTDNHHDDTVLEELRYRFMGLDRCCITLLVCVLGEDWVKPHETLGELGHLNNVLVPLFLIFVNIGVMNIVVGVFTNAQSGSKDRNAIAVDQINGVEEFCRDMVNLFQGMDTSADGHIQWEEFKEYFYREEIQAYLAYHGLDTSHVNLIFRMIDRDNGGQVNLRQLVIGMLRMRGDAKGLDTRLLLHGLKRTVKDLQNIQADIKQIKEDFSNQEVKQVTKQIKIKDVI